MSNERRVKQTTKTIFTLLWGAITKNFRSYLAHFHTLIVFLPPVAVAVTYGPFFLAHKNLKFLTQLRVMFEAPHRHLRFSVVINCCLFIIIIFLVAGGHTGLNPYQHHSSVLRCVYYVYRFTVG